MKAIVLCAFSAILVAAQAHAAEAPKPFGPVPSPRQLRWADYEMYGFIHFGPNTFTNREWGEGDESPEIFNPTDFDADQIVRTLKDGGMYGALLTCKHHDGFCLWPSKYTEHSVKNSPWKNGKGDVVREMSDACRRHGLKFGVYLSPWDRHHEDYGRPAYVKYYQNQLRELMTGYGPLFEVWFDLANGGSGYYGGARTTRNVNQATYYDWKNTWQIVRDLQPDACMFSDVGPDVRWVGNEDGIAGKTCWATLSDDSLIPGKKNIEALNTGERDGTHWMPAEADVSIRPGWFYHPSENDKVKSVPELLKIYYASVGRGCNLVLNLPPDRRGQIYKNDAKALIGLRHVLDATFATDLARAAGATASNTRGDDPQFGPAKVVDGDRQTYWSTDDNVTTGDLVLDLGKPITFNVLRVREYLPLGQRVRQLRGRHSARRQVDRVGLRHEHRQPTTVADAEDHDFESAACITKAAVCPAISEFGLFLEPPVK